MTIKRFIYGLLPGFANSWIACIEASPLGYRLAKGAFWSMAGAVILRGFQLLASIFVARMLGKVGFGELGIIQSTVGMFGVFAGFGLGLTATKHVAEFRVKDPAKAGRIMALSGLVAIGSGGTMALVLVIFAPWLAVHTLAAPHLSGLLQIAAGLLFLSALNGAQTGALAGFEAFKTIARVNFFAGVSAFPLLVGGVYIAGLAGAVWGLVASMGVSWLLNHLALRREAVRATVPFSFSGCWQERVILWRFSVPAVLSGAMVGPATWACSALLVNQTNGYAEMGIYNAVLRIKQVPEMVLAMLMSPVLPILSEQFAGKDTVSYNKTLSYAFAVSLAVVVPISLIQMAMPALTLMPYGHAYQGNYAVVQWLMLHAMLIGLFSPMGRVIASMNRMWFGWAYNLTWSAVYLLLAYLLVPAYGAAGLAAAVAVTHLVTSLPCVAYIYRYERAFIADTPLARHIIEVFFLLAISMLVYYFAPPLLAGAGGAVLASLYVIYLIWRMKKQRLTTKSIPSLLNHAKD